MIKWFYNFLRRWKTNRFLKKINLVCKKYNKPCIIYVSYYEYYDKLTQRPQHIFNKLSKRNQPAICCTLTDKFSIINKNLFVIPFRQLPRFIHAKNFDKVFMIPYNYPYHDSHLLNLDNSLNNDTIVIYELIDDFELLGDSDVVTQAKEMFVDLIKRDKTFVLTSANKLYNTALELGADPAKVFISKNAVNINDFEPRRRPSSRMQEILSRGKPIIGYYGAIADWFDFDLLKTVVKNNPQWEFVVIGPENENTKQLMAFDNFTYVPSISYADIPSYAQCWDVATIPFKINNVTLGTSPVKMFEYMAMGLPIVTTPMPECMLYDSVFVARDAAEFEQKIRDALAAKDDAAYQQTLAAEAAANTWDARVDDIVQIIDKNYKK